MKTLATRSLAAAAVLFFAFVILPHPGAATAASGPAGFNRPLVTLTFDDGYETNITTMLPVIQSLGLPATQFVATTYAEGIPSQEAILLQLKNAGLEIGSHSVTHPDLTTVSDSRLAYELKHSQQYLQGLIGAPVPNFATPFGNYNDHVLAAVARYYRSQRSTDENIDFNTRDSLWPLNVTVRNMQVTTTLSEYQGWLAHAKATRSWLVLAYRVITDTSPTRYDTHVADFNQQMAALVASGITVERYNDALNELLPQTTPGISGMSPGRADCGMSVQGAVVKGSNLQTSAQPGAPSVNLLRGGRTISAANVVAVSPSTLTCDFDIPADSAKGVWDLQVINPSGVSATRPGAFEVGAMGSRWFLAEGSTAWGFDCHISIENPNAAAVMARIRYMTSSGRVDAGAVMLPPMSQTVVNPRDSIGSRDFSTEVDCDDATRTIAVDHTMTWTGKGAASGEGHSSIGVPWPARTWYMPEGSSRWGFETWLLIQNPGTATAHCMVTYMTEDTGPRVVEHDVPPLSRASFSMASDVGARDASIEVTSDVDVVPERSMFRNNRREGHDSIGATAPATDYYLAEGTTGWGFTTYLLVQNPNSQPADVTITCMTPGGLVMEAPFTMPADSRKTVRLNDLLAAADCSIRVHSPQGIIAERSMYWESATGEATHDSIGTAGPHTNYYLPDGETSNGRETWTLVENPNPQPVDVEVSYLTPSGTGDVVFGDRVPAYSRRTYNMSDRIPQGRAAVLVRSKTAGGGIVVERSMYWNSRGAGTNTIGGFSD
ncbi:MAG TPA: DUF5719 family protein [Candidatus Anoxymicrobiaceae bacterium]